MGKPYFRLDVVLDRYNREDGKMSEKNYLIISAAVFALVAILHSVRLLNHWSMQVGTIGVPIWGSWLIISLGGFLSVWAFRLISQWRITHQ
jgi:hypothetical protein